MADTAEVSTHFRIPILNGESTFSVKVPRHYLENNRKFFFSQLNLVPDYFSQDAEDQNLDADPDLEQMIEMDVFLKIRYENYKTVYVPEPFQNTTVASLKDVIANLNTYYENNKPEFALTTPCFIDWIDIVEAKTQDVLTYVPKMCSIYYGEGTRSSDFTDYLPNSARVLDQVNNFMPPFDTMISAKAFGDRIRLRFWLAPFTKAIFSSKEPFANDFGFMEDQMGVYLPGPKQYHVINDAPVWKPIMIGKLAPKLVLTRKDFKMVVIPSRVVNEGYIRKIVMKKKDWLNDETLASVLAERFKQTIGMSNILLSFGYDTDEKIFFFKFPQSDVVNIVFKCEPKFAHRLGFGHETTISKGMKAVSKGARETIIDAKKKALTVVYDTGPILCTLDQMSSNTTSGAMDQTMAALYPHHSGILAMPSPSVCSCNANLTTIHPLTQSLAAMVPITFRLLRIYEDESISDFQWKCNAYIYGVLQGTCRKV
jgi:hypothetical protein